MVWQLKRTGGWGVIRVTDTQDRLKKPGRPAGSHNGHGFSGVYAPPWAVGDGTGPGGIKPRGRYLEPTRYLSAMTQTDISYARDVKRRLVKEPFRALAPAFGFNAEVVARWALDALRRRRHRDYSLLAALGLGLGGLLLSLLLRVWWPAAVLTVAAIVAAWVIVAQERWIRICRNVTGKMLHGRFDPADAPRNVGYVKQLTALAARQNGNLVVFSGDHAFVGSGKRWNEDMRLVIDVGIGGLTEDGEARQEPLPFSNQDVHDWLIKAFRDIGLPDENVKEWLFVNGSQVGDHPDLLPNKLAPPPTLVPQSTVAGYVSEPTPDARAYVCVEIPGWEGQLVVTLFTRAVHVGRDLYIEWNFHVLKPVSDQFLNVDSRYGESGLWQLAQVSAMSFLETLPALLCSAPATVMWMLRPVMAKRRRAKLARKIENGLMFDYGAKPSIREEAHRWGWGGRHYFITQDEKMYILHAQETLLQAIRRFLDAHNIDTEQFDLQEKSILNKSYSMYNATHVVTVEGSSILP
jgi:hypothetical protein